MDLEELLEFIDEMSIVPQDSSDVYIISHEIDATEEGLRYSLIVSSDDIIKRFLSEPKRDKVCFAFDHTYQLVTEDIPVLMVGQLLQSGPYCPVLCVLQNKEDKGAFDFVLNFIKQKREVWPVAVMGDASKAFSASVKEQLPDAIRVVCWYHMIRAVRTRLQGIKSTNSTVYNNIMSDLYSVHYFVSDEEQFSIVMALFSRKWVEEYEFFDQDLKYDVRKAVMYIMDTWVRDKSSNTW